MFDRKDHYYRQAKKEGFASRAIYKLDEIQKKFRLVKKNDIVLEWGAAPGGWTQSLIKIVGPNGVIVAIDRAPLTIPLSPNLHFIQKEIREVGDEELRKCDCIISDLSPDLSGIKFRDVVQSHEIGLFVWQSAQKFLKPGGNLVIKMFRGAETDQFFKEMQGHFDECRRLIPEATRKTSSEFYLIAKGYRTR